MFGKCLYLFIFCFYVLAQAEEQSLAEKKLNEVEAKLSQVFLLPETNLEIGEDASLEKIRKTCDFLTNDEVRYRGLLSISKRKEIFKDLARKICETVELGSDLKIDFKKEKALNLAQLQILEETLLHKSKIEEGFGFFDILGLGYHTTLSPLRFHYELTEKSQKPIENPPDSLFWKNLKSEEERKNYFNFQMSEKKLHDPSRVFIFESAEGGGSAPKVHVLEATTQVKWLLKWGDEVHTDPVASRLFAALGFNVDHPFFLKKDSYFLIFKNKNLISSAAELTRVIDRQYKVKLEHWVSNSGVITEELVQKNAELKSYLGFNFVQFNSSAAEPRALNETRLGGFAPDLPIIYSQRPVRGALLAHFWLNSWDTKTDNTLLTIIKDSAGQLHVKGVYADLGLSLGVHINRIPRDLKAGLVNEYSEFVLKKDQQYLHFLDPIDSYQKSYQKADEVDLRWMAQQIKELSPRLIQEILHEGYWPENYETLYLRKILSRRLQILSAFQLLDSTDKLEESDVREIIQIEANEELYPEGLMHLKGRFRGFGWN